MAISAQTFDEHKRFLWGICYRMIGSAADADDIVQDTFVKALEKPPVDLEAPLRPWLVKVAINLCRDQLRRRRRSGYFGPWLPSPVSTEDETFLELDRQTAPEKSPLAEYDLRESLTIAFLLALEALTPTQRAVLLLRDVFEYSTAETADAVAMTEINVKVTLHRARRIMEAYKKERISDLPSRIHEMRGILQRFLARLAEGDVEGLKRMLAAEVVLITDGGGEINALAEPVYGRAKVLRMIAKLYEAQRSIISTSLSVLNSEPAILIERSAVRPGHASLFTMQCAIDGRGRMSRLNFVFSPSKLSALKQS